MDAIMPNSAMASQRCKVIFEGCLGTSARHYLLVATEGQRFHELCGKILLDCKNLKLDQHKELASLSWKDSDEDIVNVDCEDAFQAAVSYVVPDQAGFCVLRLFAKFRPKAAVAASPTKVAPKARVEHNSKVPTRFKTVEENPEQQISGAVAVASTLTMTSPLKAAPVRVAVPVRKIGKMLKLPIRQTPAASTGELACTQCPLKFPTEIQLNGHLSCHTQESSARPSTVCQECGVKCKSQETLAKHDCHIAAVRKQKQKRRRMGMGMGMGRSVRVPLTMAGPTTTVTTAVTNTAATAAELALKRICEKCGTRCKTAESYATHDCRVSEMRREDKRKSVRKMTRGTQKRSQKSACSHCGRVLKTKSALSSHLRKCSAAAAAAQGGRSKSPDSFVCEPACGKWYGSRTSLWKHRRLCDFAKASFAGNGGSGEPSTSEMTTRRSNKKDMTEDGAAGDEAMVVDEWDTQQLGGGVVSASDNPDKESSPEIDVETSRSGSSGKSQPTSPTGPDSHYQLQINQGPYGAFKVEVPFHMVEFERY